MSASGISRRFYFTLEAGLRSVALAFLVLTAAGVADAQPAPGGAFPTFQSARIRAADRREPPDIEFLNGRFVAAGSTLEMLIEQAYGVDADEIIGGADWIRSDRFDIDADAGASGVPNERMLIMLRALLADRFKLQINEETRTVTTYALEAGDGHGLKPAADPDERPRLSIERQNQGGRASFVCDGRDATLEMLADKLADQLHAPVEDKTGDHEWHDFTFSCPADAAGMAASLESALGVRLTAGQGPVTVWVIHNAAKPKL